MQFRNYVIGALFLTVLLFCGCGAKDTAVSGPAEAVTGSTEAEESGSAGTMISGPQAAVSGALNSYDTLSVPTCIRKIGGTWFIADCYHNQVIYSDDLSAPLSDWHVLTGDAVQPHTIAGDGTVYLVDDTEQNRVLIFVKKVGRFYHTQTFDDIGNRPHYSAYDPGTDTFYVLSSMTGQMYLFRHAQGDTQMKLTAVHTIAGMEKSYIRSFMVEGGDIYFVSGIPLDGSRPCIRRCRLSDFTLIKEYAVPDSIAGMAGLMKSGDDWYITVSTDLAGSQDAATIIRTKDLNLLSSGRYEDIYSRYFIGGGTPYYIASEDGVCYLTEHRIPGHSIWKFKTQRGKILDVQPLF